jgi:hypothetical protein
VTRTYLLAISLLTSSKQLRRSLSNSLVRASSAVCNFFSTRYFFLSSASCFWSLVSLLSQKHNTHNRCAYQNSQTFSLNTVMHSNSLTQSITKYRQTDLFSCSCICSFSGTLFLLDDDNDELAALLISGRGVEAKEESSSANSPV